MAQVTRQHFFKEHGLFLFLLALCAVLRFIPLFGYQYTLDELSGLGRTQFNTFDELIENGVKTSDTHPALIQIIIYYLSQWFGYANWIIKLPFLLFSLGAVIYAYALSLRNFSKQAGIFSTAVFSFSLIFVFYAPIARMYVAGVFFSLGLLFHFFEIVFRDNRTFTHYFFFALFALLSALNQHMNALFAFTVCLSGFFVLPRQQLKFYLPACGLIVLAYLPHLPVTLYQLQLGGIGFDQGGWLPRPAPDALLTFLTVLLGTGKTYVLFVVMVMVCAVMNRSLKMDKRQWLLLMLFVVNYTIIHVYSLLRAPLLQNSVLLFSAAGLVLVICSWMTFRNKVVFHSAVVILCGALLYKTYFKKDYYHQAVKTIFEYQFGRTLHYKQLYGDKNVHPIFFDADTFMKKIYFEKYQTSFVFTITGDSVLSSMKHFSRFVSDLNCDYVAMSSSMPAQQALVASYFPYLIENTQTQALNFKVYSRNPKDSSLTVPDDVVLKTSTFTDAGNFNYPKTQGVSMESGRFLLKADSLNEFPFDAIAKYSDLAALEGQVILVKTVFKAPAANSLLTTCINVSDFTTSENYTYNAREAREFVPAADSTVTVYTDNFFGTSHRLIKDKSNINCFIWNRGHEPVEMKEFRISLIDHWPQKWHFWD